MVGAPHGLVLGTDFISDVLLIRMTVSDPVTLRPSFLSSQVALRTVAEALTIAATARLEIEATELQAEFRPALTPLGGHGREAEIYLYDTLTGGAGFTQQISELGREIFELALDRLEECPAGARSPAIGACEASATASSTRISTGTSALACCATCLTAPFPPSPPSACSDLQTDSMRTWLALA